MTYLVLARKYRPRSFDTLIGQDHVVRALTHALDTQRLHHAWLFTGTRGVGKTTLSRILAKSLNCETGITSTPCGVCQACRDIDAGRFVDYVELDAASNRGVDEMTQLLEQAVYAPSVGRFKVYMIDEVHMLTGHAFNAMLKTLEEPPAHVKFIIATTDPQKIPVTVLSRCLQFNLKQMPPDSIVSHLTQVLGEEQISCDTPALRLIAQAAGGSMRDALSLTDQAIAYSAGNVTEEAVRGMLGTIDQRHLVRLLQALGAGQASAVIDVADELSTRGLSYTGALADLSSLLSRVAIAQRVPGALDQADPLAEDIVALATELHPDTVQLFYSIAVHSRQELALAPDEYAGFVMACLRMLALVSDAGPVEWPAAPVEGGHVAASAMEAQAGAAGADASAAPVVASTAVSAASGSAPGAVPASAPAASPALASAAVSESTPASADVSESTPAAATATTPAVAQSSTGVLVSSASPEVAPATAGASELTTAVTASALEPAAVRSAQAAPVVPEALATAGLDTPSPALVQTSESSPAPAPAQAPVAAPEATQVSAASAASSRRASESSPPWDEDVVQVAGVVAQPTALQQPQAAHEAASGAHAAPVPASPAPAPVVRNVEPKRAPAAAAAQEDDLPSWVSESIPDDASSASEAAFTSDPDDDDFETLSNEPLAAPVTAGRPLAAPKPIAASGKRRRPPKVTAMTAQEWPILAASLPVTGLAAEVARQSEWLEVVGDTVRLRVAVRTLADSASRIRLQTVLCEHFGQAIRLDVIVGATGEATAHAVAQSVRAANQLAAEEAVAQDPFVQALVSDFGAHVVPKSIRHVESSARA